MERAVLQRRTDSGTNEQRGKMKTHPMLFSGPMVRVILGSRKTQTRRVVTLQNSLIDGWPVGPRSEFFGMHGKDFWGALRFDEAWVDKGPSPAGNPRPYLKAPYPPKRTVNRIYPRTQPGDLIWVRETFKNVQSGRIADGQGRVRQGYVYRADNEIRWSDIETVINDYTNKPDTGPLQFRKLPWRPSIFMPRKANRITLKVTGVRVERLNEISAADARGEGCERPKLPSECDPKYGADERTSFAVLWQKINGKGSWADNPWVWVYDFEPIMQNVNDVIRELENAECSGER